MSFLLGLRHPEPLSALLASGKTRDLYDQRVSVLLVADIEIAAREGDRTLAFVGAPVVA